MLLSTLPPRSLEALLPEKHDAFAANASHPILLWTLWKSLGARPAIFGAGLPAFDADLPSFGAHNLASGLYPERALSLIHI